MFLKKWYFLTKRPQNVFTDLYSLFPLFFGFFNDREFCSFAPAKFWVVLGYDPSEDLTTEPPKIADTWVRYVDSSSLSMTSWSKSYFPCSENLAYPSLSQCRRVVSCFWDGTDKNLKLLPFTEMKVVVWKYGWALVFRDTFLPETSNKPRWSHLTIHLVNERRVDQEGISLAR